jgi:hypothetical protein
MVETNATDKSTAAVAANPAAAVAHPPLEIIGAVGFGFNLRGEGFGTEGVLTVGGQSVRVTSWQDTVIKGVLPERVQGEIVMTLPSGVVRRGTFPTSVKK